MGNYIRLKWLQAEPVHHFLRRSEIFFEMMNQFNNFFRFIKVVNRMHYILFVVLGFNIVSRSRTINFIWICIFHETVRIWISFLFESGNTRIFVSAFVSSILLLCNWLLKCPNPVGLATNSRIKVWVTVESAAFLVICCIWWPDFVFTWIISVIESN